MLYNTDEKQHLNVLVNNIHKCISVVLISIERGKSQADRRRKRKKKTWKSSICWRRKAEEENWKERKRCTEESTTASWKEWLKGRQYTNKTSIHGTVWNYLMGCCNWAVFNLALKVIHDCFGFGHLRSVIGPDDSCQIFNQLDSITFKTEFNHDLYTCVFPRSYSLAFLLGVLIGWWWYHHLYRLALVIT